MTEEQANTLIAHAETLVFFARVLVLGNGAIFGLMVCRLITDTLKGHWPF